MKTARFFGLFFFAMAIFFTTKTAHAETITAPASITADTVWSSANTYVVQSTTTVAPGVSLSIDPGTVIKFKPYAKMVIKGTLVAPGSEQANIVFTSYKDDAYGGDTNGDGTATVPARGDWYCLESYAGGAVSMDYCRVLFGGYSYSMVYSSGGTLNVDHCIVEHSYSRGIESNGAGFLTNNQLSDFATTGIYVSTGSPIISGNTITGGNYGIYIVNGMPQISGNTINNSLATGIHAAGGSPAITGNYLNGGSGNNRGIVVANGTVTAENNNILNFSQNEAVLLGSTGGTVSGSIHGNTISQCKYPLGFSGDRMPSINFDNNYISGCSMNCINLNVALAFNGTIPVYTLPYTVSGLTVKSGATVEISPGTIFKMPYYGKIAVYGTLNAEGTEGSPIVFTSYRDDAYGGDSNGDGTASVPAKGDWSCLESCSGGSMSLNNCSLRYGGYSYSMIYSSGGVINVDHCTIEQSKSRGIEIKGSGAVTNNQLIGFDTSGIYVNGVSPEVSGNTITGGNYGIYILSGTPNISSNTINNTSTAGIYVASGSPNIRSNTINNSSTAGIYVASGSLAITGNCLNGGAGNNVGVVVDNGTVTIENNIIAQFYYEAVLLGSDGGTVSASVYGNTINDCMYPLGFRGNKIPSVTFGDNICNCNKSGINLYVSLNSCTVPVLDLPYIVTKFDIKSGATVEISPGVIFKINDDVAIIIFGTLNAVGSADNPVVFTSIRDDSFAGDTNKDGTATSPQSWDWNEICIADYGKVNFNCVTILYACRGIYIGGQSSELSIDYCDISITSWGIDISGSSNVVIKNSKIHHNGKGMQVGGASPVVINNEIFNNNLGLQIFRSSSAVVTGNDFHHNTTGLQVMMVSGDTYGCNISYNSFENNSYYGLENWPYNQPPVAIAENNWWGSPSGPKLIGTGDSINSTTLIDVSPWLLEKPAVNNDWDLKATFGETAKCALGLEPVNLSTGNFIQEETDVKIPTVGQPLEFTRFYNSLDQNTGPLGKGWTHNYNTRLAFNSDGSVAVSYADGHVLYFQYDGTGYVTPSGYDETLSAGPDNAYVLTFKDKSKQIFNSAGQLTGTADKNGSATVMIYTDGRLSSAADPSGRSLTFAYDSAGHITGITDPAGLTVIYTYDAGGNLAAVHDVRGGTTRYTYNQYGLTDIIEPNGNTLVHNEYDTQGRVISQTDGSGSITGLSYDTANRRTTMTDPAGNEIINVFDEKYRTTAIAYPGGVTETYTYGENGFIAAKTDKNGNTAAYTYDSRGNMLTQTDPLLNTTGFAYDEKDNLLAVTNPLGIVTGFTFDDRGNPLTVTGDVYGLGVTTSTAYNQFGRPVSNTGPNGGITTYTYDEYGNKTSVTDPLGSTTTFTYDMLGRALTKTDPKGNTTSFTYDAAGNLLTVTDQLGNVNTMAYDANGNLINVTDANGNTATNEYNGNNKLTRVTDPLGNITTYQYDVNGNLKSETDPKGRITSYSYDFLDRLTSVIYPDGTLETLALDGNGNLTAKTDPRGSTKNFEYDSLNRLTKVTDPEGGVTTTQYDPIGNVKEVTDPRGSTITFNYDNLSRLLSATDPLGNTTSYTFDKAGKKLSATNAMGATWNYTYDAVGRLLTVTDPLGHITSAGYDSVGNAVYSTNARGAVTFSDYDSLNRLVSVTDALGNTTQYTYDKNGNLASFTDARGKVRNYAYDQLNRLVQETDPLGNVTTYEYDQKGNLLTKTDPNGQVLRYGYDSLDRLASVTYPDGGIETRIIDSNGNMISKTDPLGNITDYQYNSLNRLIRVTDPEGGVTTNQYDPLGNLTEVTDQRGNTSTFTYDPLSRLKTVSDPLGRTTSYIYDSVGNKISATNAKVATWKYGYDTLGRRTAVTDPLGNIKSTAYDSVGNAVYSTDANGFSTYFDYDPLNRLVTVTDALGAVTGYTYDQNGNLISVKDARGNVTTYDYDALNRQFQQIDPLGNTISRSFDPAGNLASDTRPDSTTTSYSYDNNNRLAGITYPNSTGVTFAYDVNGNRTAMTDPNGTTSYSRNSLGRITSVERNGNAVSYEYDLAGNKTGITYPGGMKVNYSYNELNQPVSVTGAVYGTTISYDELGNRLEETLPNGVTVSYNYDDAVRLTSLQHTRGGELLAGVQYTYDSNGNRTTTTDEKGKTASYTYDALNQIAGVQYPGGNTLDFTYDAVGNRTSGGGVSYSYDADNRLIIAGGIPYNYDPNGNLISVGDAVYCQYDYEDRLVFYSGPPGSFSYTYDGDGNRTGMSVAGSVYGAKEYIYDTNAGLPLLLAEKDNSGNQNNYIYGGRLLSRIGTEGEMFYHQDGLGSISVISDVYGNPLNRYTYDAFGNLLSSNESVDNIFGFTGEPRDPSGLTFLRARYYDPVTGRFISIDTYPGELADPLSRNLYTYCRNNPVIYVDPSGKIAVRDDNEKAYLERLAITGSPGEASWAQHQLEVQYYFEDTNNPGSYITYEDAIELNTSTGLDGGDIVYPILIKQDIEEFNQNDTSGRALQTIIKEAAYGNYYEGDPTPEGTTLKIGASIVGLDVPVDARDILYDLQNWEWSFQHAETTAIDAIGFAPIVGGLKYGDEVSSLAKNKKICEPKAATEGAGKTKPDQLHHFATNKSKTYTPKIKEVTDKYGLDLDKGWNKEYLQHQGRHPNEYHDYILDQMKQFDNIAKGDKNKFLELYNQLKQEVINTPEMLTKNYWK